MSNAARLPIRDLERFIQEECRVHRRYLEVLRLEREQLSSFHSVEVSELSAERELLSSRMKELHDRRRDLMRLFPEGGSLRLREVLRLHCPEEQALRAQAEELSELALEVRSASAEFSHVLNFALSLVHGSISLVRSATQSVTRSYTPGGEVREAYAPFVSRMQGVLREA